MKMYDERSGTLPNFITAQTMFGLRKKMYKNRKRLGLDYLRYYDIGQATTKRGLVFVAWYDSPLKTDDDFEKLINDSPTKKGEVKDADTM